jgi:3-hydroxybutyryl-CoA dehydrogenase
MSSDAMPGLNGVSDARAQIAGVLDRVGVNVTGVAGAAIESRAEAVAAGMWFAYLNEAAKMFEQEYATRDDIDSSMRFGCGYPVGPLRQLDTIGLEKVAAILDVLHEVSGDPRHRVSGAIVDRVASGHNGESSGAGFYTYEAAGSSKVVVDEMDSAREASAMREITLVGVIGTGTMATGIIEVFAKSGLDVVYVARSEEKVAKVRATLEKSFDRAVAKGRMTEDAKAEVLNRICGVTKHEDLARVDLVVEAIVEDLDTKKELFVSLDRVCKPGAILATTTSSLSIDDLASATSRPRDVIGMHFFNPAPIMKLVEVVSGSETADDVRETVVSLCKAVRKHPVLCGDRAGFIVNFLLFPYLNDAVNAVDWSLTTIEDFDPLMKAWQSLPLGPFSLLDVVGNDVSLAIENTIVDEFGDPCYTPAKGLQDVVAAGKLGRKTGEGFLSYS